MRFGILLAMLSIIAVARADDAGNPNADIQAAIDALNAEAHCYAFPGPEDGQTRPVCVWWPKNSTQGRLPVLYVADGMAGLYISVIDIKQKIESGALQPFMVVAMNAKDDAEARADEYLPDRSARRFGIHEDWLINKVVPWAEKTKRAATERERRFIGGFSNGADLALALANRHPDLFGGAMLHSPFGGSAGWIVDTARTQRWVVTGGTREVSGSIHPKAQLPRDIIFSLEKLGAPVRSCIGSWEHKGRNWRQLSAGSIAWLMNLGPYAEAESALEKENCKVSPGATSGATTP
jgi:hypothetical protein